MKFLGRGVVTHGGKMYGYGDELPKDLHKATMARLKKLGQVGEIPVPVKGPNASDARIAELEERADASAKANADLEDLNADLTERADALESANKELTEAIAAQAKTDKGKKK